MAVNEISGFLKFKDANGDTNLLLPITTKDNVDGLDEIENNIDSLNEHTANSDIHFTADERNKLKNIEAEANKTVVDSAVSDTSTNPVQNKVVKEYVDDGLAEKQPKGDYLTTETDPTVPAWAKAEKKPTYTASEVGAVPTTRKVNGKALSSDITLTASDVGALPSTTQIPSIAGLATENYVDNKVAAMVDSAPDTLNTLNELAAALGDDPNFATTVATQIGNISDRVGATKVSEQITAAISKIDYPVDSVNGKTGTVQLTASDVEAAPTVHSHDWESIENRPFGDLPTGSNTLYWDGNREGLVRADDYEQYLISESTPTLDDFANGASNTKLDGDTETSTNLELNAAIYEAGDGCIVVGNSIIALKDGASLGDTIYPKKGTYFTWIGNDCYTTSLTINGYNGFPSTKQIDPQWIPDHTHVLGPTPIVTSGDGAEYTANIDGITELYNGLQLVLLPHTNSTTTTVKLNVNGLGAKLIRQRMGTNTSIGVAGATDNWIVANKPFIVTYNGSVWMAEITRPDANNIYGTVKVANGGTGKQSVTANSFLVGNGTEAMVEKTPDEVLSLIGAAPADAVINNNALRRGNFISDVLNVDLNNPDGTANRSGYFDTSSVNLPSADVTVGVRDVYFVDNGFVVVEARCNMKDSSNRIWRNTFNKNASGWIGWESLDKRDFLSVNGGQMKDGAYINFMASNEGITWQYPGEYYVLRPLAGAGLELLANKGNGYYAAFRVRPDGKLELGNTEITDIRVKDGESQGYVHIHNDGEGGTMLIASPNNTYHYEFDAYNDRHLRIHTADKNPNGNAKFWTFMGDSGEFHSESISTTNPIAVQYGGTGAANAESARANLGAAAESDLKRRRIYVANGMFLNDATATGEGIRGTGSATINIEPNGIARIDFALKIEYPPVDGNGNETNYGINRDMLQLINPNIPTITPIGGGVCTIYNADSTINADLNGYGAAFGVNGCFWVPGRVYQREQGETSYKGLFGWWQQGVFTVGMRIVGTCYGTVD